MAKKNLPKNSAAYSPFRNPVVGVPVGAANNRGIASLHRENKRTTARDAGFNRFMAQDRPTYEDRMDEKADNQGMTLEERREETALNKLPEKVRHSMWKRNFNTHQFG